MIDVWKRGYTQRQYTIIQKKTINYYDSETFINEDIIQKVFFYSVCVGT